MEKFIFLIQSDRDEKGSPSNNLKVDFEGYDYELSAAFVLLGRKHEFIKSAILYAADNLRGMNLRDESRVKEDQNQNINL
jgi:hypothetical protein